jgi:Ca-activated chloride channel family protein
MSLRHLVQSARGRRALAACVIVLAVGGLILYRAEAGPPSLGPLVAGRTGVAFSGPGAAGTLSLSHGKVLAGSTQPVLAELRFRADESARPKHAARGPLALAVVLDTSGSMSGDKIEDAKRSVLELLARMGDEDAVALVRFDSRAELVQPLARVRDVRSHVARAVRGIEAGGGTNIPDGLRIGLEALSGAGGGRVRRLVVASDGLDDGRGRSEESARAAARAGVTVSALGIGLDFDEGYLSAVARAGRGNFAFVENAGALARFFGRELDETVSTSVEDATARIALPSGVRLVSAFGAELVRAGGEAAGEGAVVELALGSLFTGDERRVVLELAASTERAGARHEILAEVSWRPVGDARVERKLAPLALVGAESRGEVDDARDGRVLASAASVLASQRQLEAADAYAKGDVERARRLTADNLAALESVAAVAPVASAEVAAQMDAYREAEQAYASPAGAPAARAAAKRIVERDSANLDRQAF